MSTTLYLQLSALMFMEYAVWGAWMPVLAARLLGPLQMTAKQTGWIYATLPLASMISPLFGGWLADKYLDTGHILAFCHAAGAVLLFAAARIRKFVLLFVVMLAYSLLYGATIPLVNSLMFNHLSDPDKQSPAIFIWAPVAWSLVGMMLSGWRNLRKGEGDGSDCLKFAALLSVLMVVVCLLQPATPPKGGASASPVAQALGMLRDPKFAVFIVVSLVVSGLMQFYFLGTARFLTDLGVSSRNIPASMGIAQAAQAVATLLFLGLLFDEKVLGPKWTITLGAGCWAVLYLIYVLRLPKVVVVPAQAFHGLAYVFFMIAGQMYVRKVAPPEIVGSAQALIILVTVGIGLFLGTQLAGFVMDKFSRDGRFDWGRIYTVPLALTLAGVLALALAF
ncbi:MAG: MFS transporter [Verrucomicrobiae bacterium]|nr:MFS transporter [Verrucomicrobiae bacterium]